MKFLFLLIFCAQTVFASDPILKEKIIEEPIDVKIEKKIPENSQERREESMGTAMVGYQPLATWLPSKKVLSYTHIFNSKWSLEGEYSWSSISGTFLHVDFGSIKEKRATLQARRYMGNSFNFTFGLVHSSLTARVGSDLLDSFGNEVSGSISAQNLGLSGGFGNRWQLRNGFTFGIDWMRFNIPVTKTNVNDTLLRKLDSEDKEDVQDIIRGFNQIPTVVLLGLSLGYTF